MRSTDRRALALAVACSAVLTAMAPAQAQSLYKYRNERGVWVYTDRPPESPVEIEQVPIERREASPVVELFERVRANGTHMLAARNSFYGTVQIAFELLSATNLAGDVPERGNRILDPRSVTELFPLHPVRPEQPMNVEYAFQYLHGHPGAKHPPEEPYRLPYALATEFPVSQAFPDTVTHTDLHAAAHLFSVDERPVRRTAVFDEKLAFFSADHGMSPRNHILHKHHI